MNLRWKFDHPPVVREAQVADGIIQIRQTARLQYHYQYAVYHGTVKMIEFKDPIALVRAIAWAEDEYGVPDLAISTDMNLETMADRMCRAVRYHYVTEKGERLLEVDTISLDVLFFHDGEQMEYPDVLYKVNRDSHRVIVSKTGVPVKYMPRFSGWIVNYWTEVHYEGCIAGAA